MLKRTHSVEGSITEQWQIDTPEDVALYQQLMELTAQQPSALGELIHQHVPPLPTPRRTTKPAMETITLGKARDAWLDSIKASTPPKPWTIKQAAIDLLTRFLGEKIKLYTHHPLGSGSAVSAHERPPLLGALWIFVLLSAMPMFLFFIFTTLTKYPPSEHLRKL